jgi:WXG100 family type VII secretion target
MRVVAVLIGIPASHIPRTTSSSGLTEEETMAGADPRVMDIDRDGIARIGARINEAQSEFARRAGELQAQLGNMQRDWQGEAGMAFGRLMVEWQQRQDRITKVLQAFEESLTHTQRKSVEQDVGQAGSVLALTRLLDH